MGAPQAEALSALLTSGRPPNDAALKGALTRLLSDARARLTNRSDSTDFFVSSLAVLARIKGAVHSELRLAFLWDCILYFYFKGDSYRALTASRPMMALASMSGSKMWHRKAMMLEGVLNADIGNVAEAFLFLSRSLEQARAMGDLEGEVSVLINIGVAMNYGALYAEAIPCLTKAIEIAKARNLAATYVPSALTNLAQAYQHLEQFQRAFDAAAMSLEATPEPTDIVSAFSAITRGHTFVELALELGKLDAARRQAKVCAARALWSGSPRGKGLAGIATAMCEVYGGRVDRGFTILEGLLEEACDIETIRSDVLVALVRAHDATNQPERALHYLQQLLTLKREKRSQGIMSLLSNSPEIVRASEIDPQIDLRAFELKEAKLKATVAEREAIHARLEMLERLAIAADLKEEASGEHGYRVGRLSALLAMGLGRDLAQVNAIEVAARVHDIGKLSVPDRILLSSVQLGEAERHFISAHTTIGAELLAKSNIPQLRLAEEIARYHHEWWNGEGYPSKLKGKRIPIHARIVALADVFDALTHGRPFSKPWPIDRAIEEIRSRKGTQFDPELTDVFLALVERLRNEHQDLDEYLGRAGRNSPFLQARNKIRMMLAEERDQEKKATVEGNETRH